MPKRPGLNINNGQAERLEFKRVKTKRQKLSPLESLPAELLQEILVYSLNPEFPLLSKYLARTLTSPHLMEEMLYQAFVQYPDCLLKCPRDMIDLLDVDKTTKSMPRDGVRDLALLQHRLIQSRFFTWDCFLRLDTRLAVFLESTLSGPRLHEATTGSRETSLNSARPRVPFDGPSRLIALYPWLSHRWAFLYLWAITDGNIGQEICRIPLRVLKGPWTKEQLSLLNFFTLTTKGSKSCRNANEVVLRAVQGLSDAIKVGNSKVLDYLSDVVIDNLDPEGDHGWVANLFTQAILTQTHRPDIHSIVIYIFIASQFEKVDPFPIYTTNLLEREVWDWLEANHRKDPAAKRLKNWIEAFDGYSFRYPEY